MTRKEQIKFCRKCENRKMDPRQGLICQLTSEKAAFEKECPDMVIDPTVKDESDYSDANTAGTPEYNIRKKIKPEAYQALIQKQNFPLAVIGGSAIMIIGLIFWTFSVAEKGFRMPYLIFIIGPAIALVIRFLGKPIQQKFLFLSWLLILLTIVFGFIVESVQLFALKYEIGFFQAFGKMTWTSEVQEILDNTRNSVYFKIIILLGIAYLLTFRSIPKECRTEDNSLKRLFLDIFSRFGKKS